MIRRLLPTLIALVIGLMATLTGLTALQGVFMDERDDALTALAERRRALQQYAAVALLTQLDGELEKARARIENAEHDPRISTDTVYLRVAGEQMFPRRIPTALGGGSPAKILYHQLVDMDASIPEINIFSHWTIRLRLRAHFIAALRTEDPGAIDRSFSDILHHRSQYPLSGAVDLPYMMAVLRLYIQNGKPSPMLFRLLDHGLDMGDGLMIPALQSRLLRARGSLRIDDFEFLGETLVRMCADASVDSTDFEMRFRESARAPLPVPKRVSGPSLAMHGTWYMAPLPDGQVVGTAIDLASLVESVGADMVRRALLDLQDNLVVAETVAEFQAAEGVNLEIDSLRWATTTGAIIERYHLKSGLVVLVALLALAIAALALLTQKRKQQFIELKSDFVATVSHELRTPLASMRLLAETLERRFSGDTRARDYPSRIVRDIDGLSFLVENILSFNRLEKGRLEPRLEDAVSIEELVAGIDADRYLWTRKSAVVTLRGLEGAEIEADPDLLRLMFLNLIRNAAQYNECDPVRIEVSAHRESAAAPTKTWRRQHRTPSQQALYIRVKDNGVGIPEAEIATIFDEFQRGRDLGSAHSRGSGLGLAICRRIMQIHGGDITVLESSPCGTTFELRF